MSYVRSATECNEAGVLDEKKNKYEKLSHIKQWAFNK